MDETTNCQLMLTNYKSIMPFVNKHKRMSYMQFDYAIVHEVSLFITEPNFSFKALEDKIDKILIALPSIKRIFAQPLTHLKQKDVILPVEAVRIINNKTLQHIASHSELWSDVSAREIKPVKLLSRTYEDNYGIYENLVFCKTVDDVMNFVRGNIRIIQELIYANKTIEINLLERVNHLEYFIALGKLHTGYSRNFDLYYTDTMRCLNKLQFIANTVTPRLKRPVYRNNKSRPAQIKLHKTNILSMHREYHQVYKLAKRFAASVETVGTEFSESDFELLQKSYFHFCQLLCIFAAGHFNFTCDENKPMDFQRLCVDFQFKQWKLCLAHIKGKTPLLGLVIQKDRTYTAVIAPTVLQDDEAMLDVKRKIIADEYAVFTPFEDANGVYVDIASLESMRRVQQIILRGMVYADEEMEECPFCRHKLTLSEKSVADNVIYNCPSCRTEIGIAICPETGKSYRYTRIDGLRKTRFDDEEEWLTKRKREAAMYFRNITDLNEESDIVCPHCGKVHVKQ